MAEWASTFDVCEEYRQAILAEMDARELTDEHYVAFVASGQVAFDHCCGQLSVGWDGTYRSVRFPQPSDALAEQCWQGTLVMQMTVTVVRCVPVLGPNGDPPPVDDVAAAHRALALDAAAVWDVVNELLPDEEWERAGLRQIPVSADGGCIGVTTQWLLGLDQSSWLQAG